MADCPLCGKGLKIVTKVDGGELAYLKCAFQKTEKVGGAFKETGKCKFKINFKTKLYEISKDEMKQLLNLKEITIKDDNLLKLDLKNEMFTEIIFKDKYSEEDF